MDEIYKNLDLNDLPNEIWLPIEGYENYQVSSYGRVKSLGNDKLRKEKILSQYECSNGYLYVILCKEGKVKNCRVNRLVGNAFLENKNNLPCFNHKNEIKTDNRAENLEPCTHKYNLNYKNAQAKRVASTDWKAKVSNTDYKAIAEKLSSQVYQYDKDGTLVAIWKSTRECGRQGFNQGNVSACCNNCFKLEGNNVYKNYIWSYTPLDSK